MLYGEVSQFSISMITTFAAAGGGWYLHLRDPLKLECYAAIGAAFLAHCQATEYTDWEEYNCTAQA